MRSHVLHARQVQTTCGVTVVPSGMPPLSCSAASWLTQQPSVRCIFGYAQNATEELERLEHAFDAVRRGLFQRLHDGVRAQIFNPTQPRPFSGARAGVLGSADRGSALGLGQSGAGPGRGGSHAGAPAAEAESSSRNGRENGVSGHGIGFGDAGASGAEFSHTPRATAENAALPARGERDRGVDT